MMCSIYNFQFEPDANLFVINIVYLLIICGCLDTFIELLKLMACMLLHNSTNVRG